jgi:hypothetical protein
MSISALANKPDLKLNVNDVNCTELKINGVVPSGLDSVFNSTVTNFNVLLVNNVQNNIPFVTINPSDNYIPITKPGYYTVQVNFILPWALAQLNFSPNSNINFYCWYYNNTGGVRRNIGQTQVNQFVADKKRFGLTLNPDPNNFTYQWSTSFIVDFTNPEINQVDISAIIDATSLNDPTKNTAKISVNLVEL